MTVSYVTFTGNWAKFGGGAIWKSVQGKLSITDSLFDTPSPCLHRKNYSGGEVIYSDGELTMSRTRIRSIDDFSEEKSLILQMSRTGNITINAVNVTCSTGKDITVTAPIPAKLAVVADAIVTFHVKCSSCPP